MAETKSLVIEIWNDHQMEVAVKAAALYDGEVLIRWVQAPVPVPVPLIMSQPCEE